MASPQRELEPKPPALHPCSLTYFSVFLEFKQNNNYANKYARVKNMQPTPPFHKQGEFTNS